MLISSADVCTGSLHAIVEWAGVRGTKKTSSNDIMSAFGHASFYIAVLPTCWSTAVINLINLINLDREILVDSTGYKMVAPRLLICCFINNRNFICFVLAPLHPLIHPRIN